MNIFFFLKPIADLLYQYQVLDYLLTVWCIVFLIKEKSNRLCSIDYCVIALMGIFFLSFLRNTDGWSILLKIESGFLLYFLGREYYRYWGKITASLQWGFLVIFLVSVMAFVSGHGFQSWGTHNTFTSFYYFKTDAAYAFSQCFIFFSIGYSTCRYKNWVLALCVLMTFFTNARAHYFIIFILSALYGKYRKDTQYGINHLTINYKLFLSGVFIVFVLLVILNYLSTYIGDRYLLFQFNSLSDLMNGANTQGRTDIWQIVYKKFNHNDFFTRLIGLDLVSATAKVNGEVWSAHNMYIKILYSIGYMGSAVYGIFIFQTFCFLNRLRARRLFYIAFGLLVTFLVSGLSCISIEDVQRSWLPMFYIGVAVSKVRTYE